MAHRRRRRRARHPILHSRHSSLGKSDMTIPYVTGTVSVTAGSAVVTG
ncbi:hypothetical protein GOB26_32835, partial [Sinorhizobium meliloti]|nr:hypothetical protein [Sinorhizobium meliloti]